MTPELKAKWVEALRSGDYKQGQKRLRDSENNFCCLGVLCDVVNPKGWDAEPSAGAYAYGPSRGILAPSFLASFGISDDVQSNLIAMNDRLFDDFTRIADYIEETL